MAMNNLLAKSRHMAELKENGQENILHSDSGNNSYGQGCGYREGKDLGPINNSVSLYGVNDLPT